MQGLYGGELDRSSSKWKAGEELYQVAMKAVKLDRLVRVEDMGWGILIFVILVIYFGLKIRENLVWQTLYESIGHKPR
ncbi:hypothetical protein J2R98_000143 [Alkalibacillus filiformis]|uniref:Flagellin Flp1-like domain-containing protein n=1 Tax=Alkalibacillus filiformis TaxID=200990 RepID=A0ABU0DPH1_9BACI|nr:hypothetical protein [Alkalibacillus filiformis]MDQ0350340.1 hypothetical protein [Alkalibacillus filiformis]